MAKMCAIFIRGKQKPNFDQHRWDQGDTCVIVNAKTPMVTGKKMDQKLYRWHTGHYGALHEMNLRTMLERDPAKVIRLAIVNMLPRNKLRHQLLDSKLIVHDGPFHTQYAQMLP